MTVRLRCCPRACLFASGQRPGSGPWSTVYPGGDPAREPSPLGHGLEGIVGSARSASRRATAQRSYPSAWPACPLAGVRDHHLGRLVNADVRELVEGRARFAFLDPAGQEFFLDSEKAAKDLVAACARSPAATPTTARSPISSASCRPAATPFVLGGLRTTSSTTRRAPSGCATPSSASSSSATR